MLERRTAPDSVCVANPGPPISGKRVMAYERPSALKAVTAASGTSEGRGNLPLKIALLYLYHEFGEREEGFCDG
jgi:hypothetical protein